MIAEGQGHVGSGARSKTLWSLDYEGAQGNVQGNGYIHNIQGGDGFMNVNICQNSTHCTF